MYFYMKIDVKKNANVSDTLAFFKYCKCTYYCTVSCVSSVAAGIVAAGVSLTSLFCNVFSISELVSTAFIFGAAKFDNKINTNNTIESVQVLLSKKLVVF